MAASKIQLQNALHKPYDRILFSREVLSPVFSSGFTLNSSLIPAAVLPNKSESAAIDKVWIYGNIQLDDNTEITCYEILLQPKVRIEQSKVAIQQYVRKLLTAGQAALINFVAPANKNVWRLTLVAKDSVLTEKGIKEKTTNPKRYTFLLGPSETCRTAAERFEVLSTEREITFQTLVNAFSVEKLSKAFFDEYTLHYQNFCDYLQESNYRKSVFNISYPSDATKQEKDKACKPIRDFVKKLLGRIVFLYFVQKKGWLGANDTNYSDGPGDFIKQLFKKSGGNDAFYSNWLTVLFFDTLNKERTNDDFTMPDACLPDRQGKTVKVPFLNGGLFDKEEFDEHILTFKSKLFHHPDFEDTILTEKSKGNARGFLDFLDAFNFTVYEDSPDDHTVAVDPEMLGHIFENLLEDNKDKGAFYTPKEIVHYMCQESLIEYLSTGLQNEYKVYRQIGDGQIEIFGNETRKGQLKLLEELGEKGLDRDEVAFMVKNKDISKLTHKQLLSIEKLLDEVKICDPAIGSGAFPMGLLQEIFSIKELIAYETGKDWNPAETKLNIIQNSIYGVDIEKGAVDIARLRFWLSLVVDEKKPNPLPNLDYKIVVGDSLISKFDGEVVEIDWEIKAATQTDMFGNENLQKRKQLLQTLTDKQRKYFDPKNKNKKALALEIRSHKIDVLINQLELMVQTEGLVQTPVKTNYKDNKKYLAASELYQKTQGWLQTIAKLKELKQNPNAPFNHFDWKLDFPEVLNPYLVNGKGGFDIVIANPPYLGEKGHKEIFREIKLGFLKDYYQSKMDIFYFFFHLGINFVKDNGIITFITTNYFPTADGAVKLRKSFKESVNVIQLINFNEFKVFDSALGQHNLITVLKKTKILRPTKVVTVNRKNQTGSSLLRDILSGVDSQTYYSILIEIFEGDANYIRITSTDDSSENNGLFEKILSNSKRLDELLNINSGCDVTISKIKDKHLQNFPRTKAKKDDGVFVLNSIELSQFQGKLSKYEKTLVKFFIKNSDISHYSYRKSDEFLLYIKWDEQEKNIDNIITHLSRFKEILQDQVERYEEPNWPWYSLHRPREQSIFESKQKILVPYRSKINAFAFCEEPIYSSRDVFFITNKPDIALSLKAVVGILNSKLIFYWLYHKGKRKGDTLELYNTPLSEIPIKPIKKEWLSHFNLVVDYIVFLKNQLLKSLVEKLMPTYFEQVINCMVYELYFPELLKKHNREIIKHLGELPEFTDNMTDEQKMKICKKVFERLNDAAHPVRINLEKMKEEIPEIAIIEGKNENN
jgi:hypothetical protein